MNQARAPDGGRPGWDKAMNDADFLREQARKCRRLAALVTTRDVVETLQQMAVDYDRRAAVLEASGDEEEPEPKPES
jgi:hypothetical protein